MAIYHFDLKSVSRALGQSAVAAWAYITGTRQVDQRTGCVYNYRYKAREVLAKGCFGPADWQACERAERRKDSKVARTVILALPHELDLHAQVSLVCKFARGLRDMHGVVVGWAVHEAPGDPRNRHGHLIITTRRVDDAGKYGAKTRELDVRPESGQVISFWRGRWMLLFNGALQMARSLAQVDGRSLTARGIMRPARLHLGPERSHQRRRGYRTAAAKHNIAVDEIERANRELALLQDRIRSAVALQRRGRVQRQIQQGYRRRQRLKFRPYSSTALPAGAAQPRPSDASIPASNQTAPRSSISRRRGR